MVENSNLLLANVPESVGTMIFGVTLIALAIGMRWIFDRIERNVFLKDESVAGFDSGSEFNESAGRKV